MNSNLPVPDRRVLLVGPAWVGDMVMAQSLLIALKQQQPDIRIDVLAPGWSRPILARMPEVDKAIEMPLTHGQLGLGLRWRLGKSLRHKGYDQAIVLPRSLKASLVPFFAGIPVRTGYRGEMRFGLINDMRPLDKRILTRTVQRFVALGLPRARRRLVRPPDIPNPAFRVDMQAGEAVIRRLGLNTDMPVLGVMPGAEYGPAKQWPAGHYGRLCADAVASGWQVWVFGSGKEHALGEEIRKLAGEVAITNLCGATTLEEAVDLLAQCRCTVTNDSGLMHIAGAVGVPVVAIYGSSSPGYTPPLAPRQKILYLDVDCSPCFDRTCRFGHYRCLIDIGPDRVFGAVQQLAG